MAEIRGKCVTLAGSLMSLYPDARAKDDEVLYRRTGKHWDELEPDGWYDTDTYKVFLTPIATAR
ncbi:MAG: hypothetical protein SWK76_04780 [Actinomycetota bacterium]|nr:hypothetical protein [Actinomycetota bacterium]